MRCRDLLLFAGALGFTTTVDARGFFNAVSAAAELGASQPLREVLTASATGSDASPPPLAGSSAQDPVVGGSEEADQECTADEDPDAPAANAWGAIDDAERADALWDDDPDVAWEGNDAVVEDPPAEPKKRLLFSMARETWVFRRPDRESRRLGYLRSGARVMAAAEPTSRRRCSKGWYEIEPRGFVCVGNTATFDEQHPVVQLSATRPVMNDAPYMYVQTRYPPPPLYTRLPSVSQQQRAEPSLDFHRRKHTRLSRQTNFVPLPAPEPVSPLLQDGASFLAWAVSGVVSAR